MISSATINGREKKNTSEGDEWTESIETAHDVVEVDHVFQAFAPNSAVSAYRDCSPSMRAGHTSCPFVPVSPEDQLPPFTLGRPL